MYVPFTPLKTICLRCQLRLSRRVRPFLARRHFQRAATARQTFKLPENEEPGKRKNNNGRSKSRRQKLYGQAGDQRVEDTAKLSIDSLGKPSEVIVLRDADSDRKPKRPLWRSVMLKDDSRKKSLSQEKIVEIVNSEGVAPDQKQINANIESLREHMGEGRDSPIFVSKSEYDDLYGILYKGYTVEQLAAYMQKTRPERVVSSMRVPGDSVFQHRTIWRTGRSPSSERLPVEETQPTNVTEQKSPKGALVTRLMQDHWRVHVHENEDIAGEVELGVSSWQLSLLNLGRG